MSFSNRQRLTTPAAVIADHGGEVPFWQAWINDELHADLKAWLRQQAAGDAELARDLRSVEQPAGPGFSTQAARELVQSALEAHAYLVAADPSDEAGETTFTDVAVGAGDEGGVPSRARHRLRPALFALLEAVEVPLPLPDQEAAEGRRLLDELVGPAAIERFRSLDTTAQLVRRRAAEARPVVLYRVLRGLVPDLCDGEHFRGRLSYRLYLRARLKHYCRRRGWRPAGPTFHDLATAFEALSRQRIGDIIRGMADTDEADWRELTGGPRQEWLAGLQLAAAEFAS
jgi:hypothetical protein